MSNMYVGSNQRWSTASTMPSWHHFQSTVAKNCQNLTQHWQHYGVRVHLYVYIPHWKVLKYIYMFTMDVGSNQRWSTASTMMSWHHFHPIITKNCQNLTQLCRCNSVRVHLFAFVPNWKVLNHFIYVQYLYVKQSKVVYSLNHDIMKSFPIDSHQELPKSDPASPVQQCMGPHMPTYLTEWCLHIFIYVPYGCGKQSKVVYSLNHDIMASFPLVITQNC